MKALTARTNGPGPDSVIDAATSSALDRHVLPLVSDSADPLGLNDLATHRIPLDQAPDAYATFQKKGDGMIEAVFAP